MSPARTYAIIAETVNTVSSQRCPAEIARQRASVMVVLHWSPQIIIGIPALSPRNFINAWWRKHAFEVESEDENGTMVQRKRRDILTGFYEGLTLEEVRHARDTGRVFTNEEYQQCRKVSMLLKFRFCSTNSCNCVNICHQWMMFHFQVCSWCLQINPLDSGSYCGQLTTIVLQ